MKYPRLFVLPVTLCLAVVPALFAQTRDRSQVPEQDTWRLTDLYPSDQAWQQAKQQIKDRMSEIDRYRGTLGESPKRLLSCLDLVFGLRKDYGRLSTYAGLSSALDTRNSKYLGMVQESGLVGSDLRSRTAFIKPEILQLGRQRVETFIEQEPGLKIYAHYLDDVLRLAAHTGTPGEERIIADAGLMADAGGSVFNVFLNADFPYPEVALSDGKTVKLDIPGFELYRTFPNRQDRRKVFQAFFGSLNDFRRTFGTTFYANAKSDIFEMKASNYKSTLEAALDANAIPVAVYDSLLSSVDASLPTLHRYLKLRQRMLGLDQLHYYDLYTPLVADIDHRYSYDEAEKRVLASLAPLGPDYVDVVKKALAGRWVDVYPTPGKQPGGFSEGTAYDVHPYLLINFTGLFEDVSTLIHELGHTMQSYLSNKNQPYPTAEYPIFVAEVASTFNEALLLDHMLKITTDDKVKLSILGNYLETMRTTLFRQTQFAEFELRAHQRAEKGQALTGDELNQLYLDITKKYYGNDQGICVVDDDVKAEWAFIPHFYMDYYVYQYATSLTASIALSQKVLSGDPEARREYLAFLSAGGSDYPINLLKKAGVDMTKPEAFQAAMKKMNQVMDQIEEILKKTPPQQAKQAH
jgi:oligoendopeptidase F